MRKNPRKGISGGRQAVQRGPRGSVACPIMRGILAGLLLALSAASGGRADSGNEAGLDLSLEKALAVPALAGARIGALVVRASDGEAVWSRNPELPLIPASNMKILTALVALELFGPAHRFETTIRADRRPDRSGVVAELGVRGGGDPAMNSEDWWRLAADLRRRGLRKIEGDLVVDDSALDTQFWHPAWGGVSSRAYHAPVGALTANYGAYFVRVGPGGEVGELARVQIDPAVEYLKLSNRALTSAVGKGARLVVDRGPLQAEGEQVLVTGRVPLAAEADLFARSVGDPAVYAGSVLKMQLQALGISVGGRVRRGRSDQAVELLSFSGRSLSEIVTLASKYSNNAMMETLVKAMGARTAAGTGTWENGMGTLKRELERLELLADGIRLSDGSGLSLENRLTARMLVSALRRADSSFRVGPELLAALPIAGRDGTLDGRLGRGVDRIRAKTGLLNDARVIALSGWAESLSGELLVFSILINGYEGAPRDAMRAVDDWASLLTR